MIGCLIMAADLRIFVAVSGPSERRRQGDAIHADNLVYQLWMSRPEAVSACQL